MMNQSNAAGSVTGGTVVKALEHADQERFEEQRRYGLLRLFVPIILTLVVLVLPFAIYADVVSGTPLWSPSSGTAQNFGVVLGSVIAFIAMRRHHLTIAALALIIGVSSILVFIILNDSVFSGSLTLGALPEFALLLAPIAFVAVLLGPRATIVTTVIVNLMTIGIFIFTPHAADLQAYQQQNGGGPGLVIEPVALQILLAALLYATVAGLRRTQHRLSTVRAAYERERELDILKNQFITSINHELRTPLMSLQGYMILAREFGKAQRFDQQDRMFMLGEESMGHINRLVESILDIRRIETDVSQLQIMPIPLLAAIEQATQLVDPRELGLTERPLILHVAPDLEVLADAEHLRQVLVNLLSNACKYSPPQSPITITATLQPANVALVKREHALVRSTPMVAIAVRDQGLGIPPEKIPLLFQRFVRLERDIASAVKGTGLGLAICRSFVEAMGGTVTVISTGIAGEGSTFTVTLPVADDASPAPIAPQLERTTQA